MLPNPLTITHDRIRYVMPHARQIAQFIDPLNRSADRFEINTRWRLSAWLANLALESGEFRYMEELADGSAYDNRADLGNTDPDAVSIARKFGTTPGRWWKGHGPIQITGYANHKACGEYFGIDLLNDPRLLSTPEWGCAAAGWFWHVNGINAFADREDFDGCCDKVNRGRKTAAIGDSIHYERRVEYLNRCLSVFSG